MKKSLYMIIVLAVLAVALAVASPAFAQDGDTPYNPGGGRGRGRGASGMMTGEPVNMGGALGDLIHENLAQALGLTPEQLTAREEAGETFAQIALDLGFDADQIATLWLQARQDAITEGLEQGLITQEQADWMLERLEWMQANGFAGATGECTAPQGAAPTGGRGSNGRGSR